MEAATRKKAHWVKPTIVAEVFTKAWADKDYCVILP